MLDNITKEKLTTAARFVVRGGTDRMLGFFLLPPPRSANEGNR
jgi:hypothetical protein